MAKAKTLLTIGKIERELLHTQTHVYDMALTLIEVKARRILVSHKELDEFVMAMGGWLFTGKHHDRRIDISPVSREYVPQYAMPFTRMMDKFDELELKVTGGPMRFTAEGPVVRSWGGTDGLDGRGVAKRYGEAA